MRIPAGLSITFIALLVLTNCGRDENAVGPTVPDPKGRPMLSGGGGSYSYVVIDSFAGTNGTNIISHTANTGQAWSLSGGFTDRIKIENNTAQLASGADNNNWRMAITTDVVDDTFDIWTDYARGSQDVPGDYAQLEFLAKSGANPPTDRVYVAFTRSSPTLVTVRLVRTLNFSNAQSIILDSAFPLSTGTTKRIGATITGLSVQVWWEPAGGGTRTNIGSAQTLTADYRDGLHKRVAFNFIGAQAWSSGSPSVDNFVVAKPAPPDTGWILLVNDLPELDTTRVVTLPGDTFRVYRTDISLAFQPTVTDVEKRAFFASHSMTFIRVTQAGRFFVRIPDPGSLDSLLRVVDGLRNESQIAIAGTVPRSALAQELSYRLPVDGPRQQRAHWVPNSTDTWAMRAIRAPLAWGCETGTYDNTPVRLGIFELKHQPTHPEFAVSSPRLWEVSDAMVHMYQPLPQQTVETDEKHASATTGLLSAEGNNNSGIAGVAWRSALYLYNGMSPANIPYPVEQAFYVLGNQVVADAPRVLSFSADVVVDSTQPPAEREATIRITSYEIRTMLDNASGLLIVVAAGNERFRGTVTQYLQYPRAAVMRGALLLLRQDPLYRDRIIVVAGSSPGNHFWDVSPYLASEGSNFFTDVMDIAAPAQDVHVLDRWTGQTGSAVPTLLGSGTSLSAPLVAGVAGLLLGMDPQLSPAQVKDYIVRGASQPRPDSVTGLVAAAQAVSGAPSSIYQIDAYSSLTLLAREQQGIPLCGNRAWIANGQILAERDTANHTTEVLGTVTGDYDVAHVRHGGRRVEAWGISSSDVAFELQGTNWVATSNGTNAPDAGAFLSLFQSSHDVDTAVTYSTIGDGNYDIKLRDVHSGVLTLLRTLSLGTSAPTDSVCVFLDHPDTTGYRACGAYDRTGTTTSPNLFLAYSPVGNEIVAVVSWRQTDFVRVNGFQPCPGQVPDDWAAQCQSSTYSYHSLRSDVYLIGIPNGNLLAQWSVPSKEAQWAAVSEDGGQLVDGEINIASGYTLEWVLLSQEGGLGRHMIPDPQQVSDCGVQYRVHRTGILIRPFLPMTGAFCSALGNGTISPAPKRGVEP